MPLDRRRLTPLLALLAALLAAGCRDADPVFPIGPDPEPEGHAFTYAPPAGAPVITSISVRGAFNDWAERPMTRQQDGSWRSVVELEDGTHTYKFYINSEWPSDMCHDSVWGHPDSDYWIDPSAEACVEDGHGGRNAAVVVGEPELAFSHGPASPSDLSVAAGRLSVRFRANRGTVRTAAVTAGDSTFDAHLQLRSGLREVWRASLPAEATSYAFTVETAAGVRTFGPYSVPGEPFSALGWVGDAVGYQIFPERFWNGDRSNDRWTLETDVANYIDPALEWNNGPVLMEEWGGEVLEFHCCHQYFGGDLQGILDRLDHLVSLGVTFLYLNPLFTSGSAHGYDTYDYLEVAPNFGDETRLRRLLDAAHARGMRVMWDFVPNHVGLGFWAFQDAVEKGESSEYWSWFDFKVPASEVQVGNGNHYDAWWGIGTLPRLNTLNDRVFDHLMGVTRYWTEFGFDGIRVDVPNEIRNREEFFRAFRQAARAINPEVYLVGEVWGRDPSWLRGDQFDALMNYAIGEAVIERFARGDLTAGAAAEEMSRLYAEYPEAATAMQFNLISSHDTARLLTKMGGGALFGTPGATPLARHRLASAMLYALPGVPVTFQGDECAFLGRGDGPREENRYPFQWEGCDAGMVAHYVGLAELRAELEGLRSPVIRSHAAVGPVLSFFRGEPGPGEVLAVFNSGGTSQSVALPEGSWVDAVSGDHASGSVNVVPFGWRFLRRS